MAKRLLLSRGIAFEEINASSDPALRGWLVEQSGQRTMRRTGHSGGGAPTASADAV